MSPPLNNATIVVIGGTTGLGFSGARACIAAGANVVVVGRDAENVRRAEENLGRRARAVVGDATQSETAERAVQLAADAFGRLDGLYHVAGGSGRGVGDGPLEEIPDSGWDQTLRLNLTSVFYSSRAAVRRFKQQGTGGAILNMGSVLAASPAPRYFATHAYASAKAAITGLTRSCAAYYAAAGIRFNVIAPALVETPMSQRACGNDEIRRYIETKQPLCGGVGAPKDLDAAVVYLLSDQSRYVTGQVLAVDGGWTVSEGQHPPEG